MVKYNSTVNINPLSPWICGNALPTPRCNPLLLALGVIKCNYFAYETTTKPSIALGFVNALW